MPRFDGTDAADRFSGRGADDLMFGLGGTDALSGGGGNDSLSGGDGSDRISGGAGDDVIFGHSRADLGRNAGAITMDRVTSGLSEPVFATSAPGDPDRLFIVEKTGSIRIFDLVAEQDQPAPFLELDPDELTEGGEEGLLGLAFHPDYQTNGQFYIYLTNADGDLEVRRYTRDGANSADPDSMQVVITIPHPDNSNHNGGWLAFGPDGYLYIATGDGGGGGDPGNNAQNVNSLLGKMLRLDVDGDDFPGNPGRNYAIPSDNPFVGGAGADEIWATGLRNPWRPSFDRQTGDLYIADVGQGAWEEINFQLASSDGGENYGWAVKEGDAVFDPDRPGNPAPDDPALVDPVLAYPHLDDGTGGFSVTGGYVYRGQAGGMQGVYFYADFVTDQIWSFRMVDGQVSDAANRTAQLAGQGGDVGSIASFAEDGRGNLYVISLGGGVFRMTPGRTAGDGADVLRGGAGDDAIHAGLGDDVLHGDKGDDRLFGQAGDDRLIGGRGTDEMTGGRGEDDFVFRSAGDSGTGRARDVISDFRGGDMIDLSAIDASAGTGGAQAFSYIGGDRFSGEGQIRAVQQGDDVILSLNIAGNGGAEMQIRLSDIRIGALSDSSFDL